MESQHSEGNMGSKEALLRAPSIDEWSVEDSTWKQATTKSWKNTFHLSFLYSTIFVFVTALFTIVLRPQMLMIQVKVYTVSRNSQKLLLTSSLIATIFSAPAQDAIKYHTVVFPENFATKGPYMDTANIVPTEETDKLWEDLYQCEFGHELFLLTYPDSQNKFVSLPSVAPKQQDFQTGQPRFQTDPMSMLSS